MISTTLGRLLIRSMLILDDNYKENYDAGSDHGTYSGDVDDESCETYHFDSSMKLALTPMRMTMVIIAVGTLKY